MSNIPFGPPPVSGSNPLQVLSIGGLDGGSNLDQAPHEIPAGQGRFLQDVLLDVPGEPRQRGILDALGGTFPTFPGLPSNYRTIGLTSIADPNGTDSFRILLLAANNTDGTVHALIYGRGSVPVTPAFHARSFFEMDAPGSDGSITFDPTIYFDDRRTAALSIGIKLADITLSTVAYQPGNDDPYFDAKPSLDGGVLMGLGLFYGSDPNASLHRSAFHWRGGAKVDYTTGTVTVTQSSKTVTGSGTTFTGNVEPGMFLLDSNSRLLGVVASVDSATQVTLERNVLRDSGSGLSYKLTSLRRPFVGATLLNAGNITASTASAVVNGGNTKFVDQGVAANDLLFKAADLTYVGKVTSVQSNTQLTLNANALVSLANDDFILVALGANPGWSSGQAPVFSAYWNGIQLAANADNRRQGLSERSRIFVLGADILDAVDLTQTGTWYDLPATKPHTDIRGIFPTESAALVFLAETTFGLFGNTPDTLVPKVVNQEDGLLSPMAVQPWKGGAVWAGHRSVYWFDGSSVQDLLAGRAARSHRDALATIDYGRFRAWSMLYNGHYLLFLQSVNPDPFVHRQERVAADSEGGATVRPSSIVYAINLASGALTFMPNIAVRGFTAPPGKLVIEKDAYYVVENSATSGPAICSAESLFADSLTLGRFVDDVQTNPGKELFSPHVFIETRLAAFGDEERLKNFKQLNFEYLLYGQGTAALGLDIVKGLSQTATALPVKPQTTSDQAVRTWSNVKSRFIARATHAAFRIYSLSDSGSDSIRLGPISVGMKLQRPGRV